ASASLCVRSACEAVGAAESVVATRRSYRGRTLLVSLNSLRGATSVAPPLHAAPRQLRGHETSIRQGRLTMAKRTGSRRLLPGAMLIAGLIVGLGDVASATVIKE